MREYPQTGTPGAMHCAKHGAYTFPPCPVCDGRRRPARGRTFTPRERDLEHALHTRPPSGPIDEMGTPA